MSGRSDISQKGGGGGLVEEGEGGGGLYLVLENIQSILVVQVMKIMFMRKFTNVYIKNIILEKRSNL